MEPLYRRQSSQNLGYSSSAGPRSLQVENSYAHSVTGGAGGRGTKISSASYGSRFGSGFGRGYDYQSLSSGSTFGTMGIGNEKHAMQHLNDRLASYLETVRNLEKVNEMLEIKIRETTEKRGPLEGRDYSKYHTIIAVLKAQILDMTKGNAQLAIAIDNARLASDDFKAKYEYEFTMKQTVEGDVSRLRKILDDINVIRLHLESQIESLKEELITLKKNHKKEVHELQVQIREAGVHVDVDAPKGQDLGRIMEEIRAKYEKIAQQNQQELEAWHNSQITEVQVKVIESSKDLKEATSLMTDTRRQHQALEIELQSAHSLKASLEAARLDIEMRYNLELEKYNAIILRLQEELAQIRSNIQQNANEYEALLNIKVKLEVEIAEYRRLLNGEGDLKLEDAVDPKKIQVVTVTQTVVDGKVVSESKESKDIGPIKDLALS